MSDRAKVILAKIRANRAALDACQGPHHFVADMSTKEAVARSRASCSKCGGELGRREAGYYADGYEAAGGSRADVMEIRS